MISKMKISEAILQFVEKHGEENLQTIMAETDLTSSFVGKKYIHPCMYRIVENFEGGYIVGHYSCKKDGD